MHILICRRQSLRLSKVPIWVHRRKLSATPTIAPISIPSQLKTDSVLFSIGAFAGALGALVGLGGAFVIIPILTGPLAMSAHHAGGTSMAAVLATSFGSVVSYGSHATAEELADPNNRILSSIIPRNIGAVDVAAAICIVTTSMIMAPIGARFSKRVSEIAVKRAQACLMLFAGSSFILRDYSLGKYGELKLEERPLNLGTLPTTGEQLYQVREGFPSKKTAQKERALGMSDVLTLGGIGVLSGFTAGFFGVGGGAIVVPALAIFMDFDQTTALGTSMAAMFPTAISGAAAHLLQGTMIVRTAIPLSLGCVIGSAVGGNLSPYINENYLKQLFSGTMFVLGSRVFLQTIRRVR